MMRDKTREVPASVNLEALDRLSLSPERRKVFEQAVIALAIELESPAMQAACDEVAEMARKENEKA